MARNGNGSANHNKIKMGSSEMVVQGLIYLVLILLSLAIILPCINVLALSFNEGKDAARGGVSFWPREWTLNNYKEVFKDGKIMNAYKITIARTVIGTIASLVMTTLSAFALKQRGLPGRKVFIMLITFTMLFSGGQIPTYIQYNNLGLLNNFWVYVIPSLMNVTYLLMIRTFFDGIPDSLEESAEIDGCGYFRTYATIIMPLSKPIIAVVGLYTAVNHWNDWFSGSFYMTSDKLWPAQTVLQQMLQKAMQAQKEITSVGQAIAAQANTVTSDSLKMSAVVVTTVPILVVYPFIQKYFTQGTMVGAVKG